MCESGLLIVAAYIVEDFFNFIIGLLRPEMSVHLYAFSVELSHIYVLIKMGLFLHFLYSLEDHELPGEVLTDAVELDFFLLAVLIES